jgi:hypothetical protein
MQLRYEDYRNIGFVTSTMGIIIAALGVLLIVNGAGNVVVILFLLSWGATFLAIAMYARATLRVLRLLEGRP